MRVLDLTAWWAGPIAAGALADARCRRHPRRVGRAAWTACGRRARARGWTGPWWERSSHYLCSNVNKRNLTLDLGTEAGLGLLRRLIAESDAVLENFSPRVLGNFGLEWEQIEALNPRCLLVRMPAFGLSGPWRDNVGFAQTMEQVTGLAWITGHRDDQPRIQRGPSDPNAGMHAAFALIVGLAEREATGRGCLLEVTMVEGALNAAAELVLEATAYGNLLERDGNRSPHVAPQGLYRGREPETWLAVSVATDEQWRSLVAALGTPAWASDADFAGEAGRRARHDELDERLAEWSATRDVAEAAELLVAHGVPAAVGRDPRSMYDHPQLQRARVLRGHRPPRRRPARHPHAAVPLRVGGPLAADARADTRPAQPRDPGRGARRRRGDLRRARGRPGHRHPPQGPLTVHRDVRMVRRRRPSP